MNDLSEIDQAEEILHQVLQQRQEGLLNESLLKVRSDWSDLIYQKAMKMGRVNIEEAAINEALQFLEKPIFIGGLARSGTTWLNSLLSQSKALCVLPSETLYFPVFRKQIMKYGVDSQIAKKIVLKDWLERLADPRNYGPYWHFSRSKEPRSLYLLFARYFLSWWDILVAKQLPQIKIFYGGILLSYLFTSGGGKWNNAFQYWIEKSPGNELAYPDLKRHFSQLKMVVVLRNPYRRLKSFKLSYESANSSSLPFHHFLEIAKAYQKTVRLRQEKAVFLLNYESLIEDRQEIMNKLFSFFDIKLSELHSYQLDNGQSFRKNSSAVLTKDFNLKTLNPKEIALLNHIVQEFATSLGYQKANDNQIGWVKKSRFHFYFWLYNMKAILKKLNNFFSS